MKIIFLDIDGVLNPHWKATWSKPCINWFNRLCSDYPDCKIVVSSTWRKNHSINELQEIFTNQGVSRSIHDFTNIYETDHRGKEIRDYLIEHSTEIVDFVIIDDITREIEETLPSNWHDRIIKTRSWLGFGKEEYDLIKQIWK